MSEHFQFLELPDELQIKILRACIPSFSVTMHVPSLRKYPQHDEEAEEILCVEAAGKQAVQNILWIPHHLRGELRPAFLSRFDGSLRFTTIIFHRNLEVSRLARFPWDLVKTVNACFEHDKLPDLVGRCTNLESIKARFGRSPLFELLCDHAPCDLEAKERFLAGSLDKILCDAFREYAGSDDMQFFRRSNAKTQSAPRLVFAAGLTGGGFDGPHSISRKWVCCREVLLRDTDN